MTSTYYVLEEKPLGDPEDLAVIESYPRVPGIRSWLRGVKFTVPVPEPLEYVLDERYPGRLPDFLKGSPPLMSQGLVETLREAGVTNLDSYEARLVDSEDRLVSDTHRAVNIVGVVAAADLSKSRIAAGDEGRMIDTSFDSLAIDETRALGLLLFRLAESVDTVLVHRSVRNHLQQNGFERLGFVEPERWLT